MVLRKCPKCSGTNDDRYGFCLKCGYEYPDKKDIDITKPIEETEKTTKCLACGYENPEEADYCVNCGMPLLLKEDFKQGSFFIKYGTAEKKEEQEQPTDYKKTSSIIIILGYIFSILGGLIGIIIAIYLSTRKDPRARKHGHVQLAILLFYLIIIAIFIGTGTVSLEQLSNMPTMNMTSLPRLDGNL